MIYTEFAETSHASALSRFRNYYSNSTPVQLRAYACGPARPANERARILVKRLGDGDVSTEVFLCFGPKTDCLVAITC